MDTNCLYYWSSATVMAIFYALTVGVGVRTLANLRSVKEYSTWTLWTAVVDAARFVAYPKKAKFTEDGRGWAAIHTGVLIGVVASAVFLLLHIESLLENDYRSFSLREINIWFLTHSLRCVSAILLFYGAAHGARRLAQ